MHLSKSSPDIEHQSLFRPSEKKLYLKALQHNNKNSYPNSSLKVFESRNHNFRLSEHFCLLCALCSGFSNVQESQMCMERFHTLQSFPKFKGKTFAAQSLKECNAKENCVALRTNQYIRWNDCLFKLTSYLHFLLGFIDYSSCSNQAGLALALTIETYRFFIPLNQWLVLTMLRDTGLRWTIKHSSMLLWLKVNATWKVTIIQDPLHSLWIRVASNFLV